MTKDKNPFSLMYGKSPLSLIERQEQYQEIIDTFKEENPFTYSFLITGIRGSGKTVLLRSISNELLESEDWIVIDANPQDDIIQPLSEKLLYEGSKYKLFVNWSLSFNAGYFSLQISNNEKITNAEIIFEKMLKRANEKGKKVLITIDEVNSTKEIKKFANFYQTMIGKNYKLFLLMTGLKDNINALVSSTASSFLSRTPKIDLLPLKEFEIAHEYQKLLHVDVPMSVSLAKLTKGYAFAYQVLGYLFYESTDKDINETLLMKYDRYLQSNGYDVIWKDLTKVEKAFCFAMNKANGNIDKIQAILGITSSYYQNCRSKLIEKGIIISNGYGMVGFALPRFEQFLMMMEAFE